MRRLLLFAPVALALLASAPAQAQFANRSITGGIGYLDMDQAAGFEWAIPLTLGYSGYVESGWEYTFDASLMLLSVPGAGQVFGGMGNSGFRYLFLEEDLRPYLGLDFSVLYVNYEAIGIASSPVYIGLAPKVGVDYFVSDTLSIGLKGHYNFYWWINQQPPVQTVKGVTAVIGAWF